MIKTDTHSTDLFKKYLSGETTDQESLLIEEKLVTDEAFRDACIEIYQIELPNQRFKEIKELPNIFEEDIIEESQSTQSRTAISHVIPTILILFVITVSFLLFAKQSGSTSDTTNWMSDTKIVTDTLPDGSIINLNKQSDCFITNEFNKSLREIYINGEIFINVTKDDKKAFIVHAKNISVTVHGTSFLVSSYNDDDAVTVCVESGKVLVSIDNTDNEYVLNPGESLKVNSITNSIEKLNNNKNLSVWATKTFNFENAPLGEVTATLGNYYNTHFTFSNNAIKNCKFTGSFQQQSLDIFCNILELSFGLTVLKKENEIAISGQACN